MKSKISILKKIYKRRADLWDAFVLFFGGILFLLGGFIYGFSYPFWLLCSTVVLFVVFEFLSSSPTAWGKVTNFFITYGLVSMVLMCVFYLYDDELLGDGLSRFSSIDTIRHDFLNYPMLIVHFICMILAVLALLNWWMNDVREIIDEE